MAFGLEFLVPLCCVGIILLGIIGFVVMIYNRLVTLRNRVNNAWAQIDVQLKRRYDLIPNLMETVKGYMNHERETLESVTRARAMLATGSVADKAQADNMLTSTLKTLFSVAESYPQLKANENFKMLQEELAGTENKISYIRTAYNDSVLEYNTAIELFPNSLLAAPLGFKPSDYFKVDEAVREAPKVKF
ncbi:MAG: LemA family protein [Candidatus Bilamarchaeum sp.]|jgi:LemA protein